VLHETNLSISNKKFLETVRTFVFKEHESSLPNPIKHSFYKQDKTRQDISKLDS